MTKEPPNQQKRAILRKKGTLGNQWQSLINSPSILLPTMRCILLVVVCWVWAGLRWWRRRRRRRTIVVRCSVASVVIPSKQSELGQGTEFKLTQCAIVYSSTKKVCSYTQSWPIQLVSLRSCVCLYVGPNTAGYDASRHSDDNYSATCDVSLS